MTEKKKMLLIEDENWAERASATLNSLNECRKDGLLCDVKIVVGDETFRAHRNILAATSDYFRDLFYIEKKKEIVEIDNIAPDIMRQCVEFIYTGSTVISTDNVRQLWAAGLSLGLQDIPARCRTYFTKKMTGKTCLIGRELAIVYNNKKLRKEAEKFGLENFGLICEQKEFLELNKQELTFFLDSDKNRFLPPVIIYDAVIRWIRHNFDERCNCFPGFLKYLNLVTIPTEFLWSTVQHEPLFSQFEEAKTALETELFQRLMKPKPCKCIVMLESKNNSIVAYNHVTERSRKIQMIENEKLTGMSLAFLQDHLFALKGKTAYKLNCQSRLSRWIRISDLNVKRTKIVTASSDDCVFVVAGILDEDNTVTGAAEYYEPCDDKWTVIRDVPTGRNHHCVVWAKGHIYCIGGVNSNGVITDNVERFDPHLGVWNLLDSKMQIPRQKAACVPYKESIYLLGGLAKGDERTDIIEQYSIPSNRWVLITRMKLGRRDFFAGVSDGKIYSCGGHDREERLSEISLEYMDLESNDCTMDFKISFGKLESATMAEM